MNYKIQIVARVGRKSAVVLSGLMEASYSHFYRGIDFDRWPVDLLKPQKLSPTSLQTLWEYQNRLLLEEYYTIDEVIPPEDDFLKKNMDVIQVVKCEYNFYYD